MVLSVQLIEVTFFLKLPADQLLVLIDQLLPLFYTNSAKKAI